MTDAGQAATDGLTGYDAARTHAAVYHRGRRGLVTLTGRDAAPFLHNVLTNDIASLAPGSAVYAAYLTPQGRMIADMTVLRREADVLLDLEPGVGRTVLERLDGSIFAEDVRLEDRSDELASLGVHGPEAWAVVAPILGMAAASPLAARAHVTVGSGADEALALVVETPGMPGVHVFARQDRTAAIRERLHAAGVPELSTGAWEALRIEAGVPVFGIDMTGDTIPLEAGIENRAISMTKGCYIGQEVIVRILHRGGGRVARRLVGLVFDDTAVPPRGAALAVEGKDAGQVTSAAYSPRLGRAIALASVQRAWAEPGTRVTLVEGGAPATVAALPL